TSACARIPPERYLIFRVTYRDGIPVARAEPNRQGRGPELAEGRPIHQERLSPQSSPRPPLRCPHCRLRVRLSQRERLGEEDTGRGCLGNQGGRPYAKRQVRADSLAI